MDAIANVNGADLFTSHREPAWHRKGHVFSEPVLSAAAMLDNLPALRDRSVTLEPVMVEIGGAMMEVPGHFVSVSNWADSAPSFYGTVGSRYAVMSDLDAFSVFDGFQAETMGALFDGRKTFASFSLDREIVLDESGVADRVNVYGLAVNSHDGTSPLMWGTTPTRVVCQNTLNVAVRGGLSNVRKIRHTATAADRLAEHAETYRASMDYADEFERLAQEMFATPVTTKQYENLFGYFYAEPKSENGKAALTKYETRRDLFMGAWGREANAGIHGTAWGAFNALTEANQWGRNERDNERGADSFTAAGMGLDGPTNKFRQDALSRTLHVAGIK